MTSRSPRDTSEYNVRAIERALQVLDCFDSETPARGITEIAHAVGLHKATAHRIVTTLANHGYLERMPSGQEYRLGMKLASLGATVLERLDLRSEALPTMHEMVRLCEESCDLGVFDHGEVLIVEIVRSPHGHALASALWRRLPAHAAANGKLFLAYLPQAEREEALSRSLPAFTEKTVTDAALLRRQLDAIRAQGYAVDDEEFEQGVRGVAAPVRNRQGTVIAALGMPGPSSRITPERTDAIATVLMAGAETISRRLGWQS